MVGHLAVPSIDSQMRPAAVSPVVIKDLLRTDLGFSGLILTDALNMLGAEGHSSADALAAGADIVVAPDDTFAEIERVVKAVESGEIPVAEIDDRLKRVLFFKYLATVADPPGEARKSSQSLHTSLSDTLAHRLLR